MQQKSEIIVGFLAGSIITAILLILSNLPDHLRNVILALVAYFLTEAFLAFRKKSKSKRKF